MESSYNGDYLRIDYREKRDIEDRDEIDGKKANSEYVSLDVNKYQQDLSVGKGKSATRYILVGSPSKNTEYAVVYMHGLNGTRFQ